MAYEFFENPTDSETGGFPPNSTFFGSAPDQRPLSATFATDNCLVSGLDGDTNTPLAAFEPIRSRNQYGEVAAVSFDDRQA